MSIKIHYRRCHCCDASNECVGELVTECHHCGKKLLPFFYFDERAAMGISNLGLQIKFKSKLPHNSYPPLTGLSSCWTMED